MKISEIVACLRPAEETAHVVYRELAKSFSAQPALATFLDRLSHDEAIHMQLLDEAQALLAASGHDPEAAVLVDPKTLRHASLSLNSLLATARSGRLTEQEMLECIVDAEFSEWNDIFLYVVTQFRQGAPAFQHIAAVMQQHGKRIEDYVATLPEASRPANLRPIPRMWSQRLLLVDDDVPLLFLLNLYLEKFGEVTTAVNGRQALELTRNKFFDVIVTDHDMPEMDGLNFYLNTMQGDAAERRRFVFMAGKEHTALHDLCAQTHSPLLAKPFALDDLRGAIATVLDQNI